MRKHLVAVTCLAWFVAACSEPGPTGATGPTGPAGSTGSTGATGANGQDGASAQVRVSEEPAGERCAGGGRKIESSVGEGPVTTSYVCNGGVGPEGASAVVSVTDEPAGPNCARGGKKLQTAVGVGPVTTSYLCNGEPGPGAVAVAEPPGTHCAEGGVKVTTESGDAYVCDGESVTATSEPAGSNCAAGGVRLSGGSSTTYVCNGEAPTLTITGEPPGSNCPAGGQKVVATAPGGATTTAYVCNGTSPDGGLPAQPCTGAYEALQWDGTAWQCVDVRATGPSGGRARGYEVVDSFGTAWDGVERPANTWSAARSACEAVGARLPTATEVWRVGASQFAEVGTSYETNFLWTLTPWHLEGATQQHAVVRLSDPGGDTAVSFTADTVKNGFRCVWPAPATGGFGVGRCHGPAGASCFQAVGEGRRMNLDAMDRPSLSYAGAAWECGFVGAHLPLSLQLSENLVNGLPNGTNEWQWTADHTRYDLVDILKWSGTNPAGWNATYATYWSWDARSNSARHRFRCMGEALAPVPNTASLPADPATWGAAFTEPGTGLVSHEQNLPAASWEAALSDCFSRGGQLPHSRDWLELIRGGLPNGPSATYSWSSDFSHKNFVQLVQWSGVDREFTGYYSKYMTWSGSLLGNTYPYRCTWYPLDLAYAGPVRCNGGQFDCFVSEKGAATAPVRVWADPVDRSPATWIDAVKTCSAEGGHLASMVEYAQLVREGLPNGQAPTLWVWSSDSEGNTDTNPAIAGLFNWGGGVNGTQTGWTATADTTYWAYRSAATTHGYRCVWSNQLR
jgi:hypothetical protein